MSLTTLQPIAHELVCLSVERGVTPVFVTSKYLVLRPAFLVELAGALADHTDRPVRIDWCRPVPTASTLVGDLWARGQAQMINRALHIAFRQRHTDAALQITASLARPGGVHRQFVIGWCSDDYPLAPWTLPVYLTGESSASRKVA